MYVAVSSMFGPVLAVLPFLPRGKGALILILGGMVVLTISLLWSFIVPRRLWTPESTPPIPFAGGDASGASAPSGRSRALQRGPAPDWVRSVISTTIRAGLGRPTLV